MPADQRDSLHPVNQFLEDRQKLVQWSQLTDEAEGYDPQNKQIKPNQTKTKGRAMKVVYVSRFLEGEGNFEPEGG